MPPRYSALKVDGARAYDLARDEEEFELAPRIVSIDRLQLVDLPDPDHCVLEAECGKGTYVRALARDLGRALRCLGHVAALRRTRVGDFIRGRSRHPGSCGASRRGEPARRLLGLLQPVETAALRPPGARVSAPTRPGSGRGSPVLLRGRDAPIVTGPVYAVSRGGLVALGEVAQGEFHPSGSLTCLNRSPNSAGLGDDNPYSAAVAWEPRGVRASTRNIDPTVLDDIPARPCQTPQISRRTRCRLVLNASKI